MERFADSSKAFKKPWILARIVKFFMVYSIKLELILNQGHGDVIGESSQSNCHRSFSAIAAV